MFSIILLNDQLKTDYKLFCSHCFKFVYFSVDHNNNYSTKLYSCSCYCVHSLYSCFNTFICLNYGKLSVHHAPLLLCNECHTTSFPVSRLAAGVTNQFCHVILSLQVLEEELPGLHHNVTLLVHTVPHSDPLRNMTFLSLVISDKQGRKKSYFTACFLLTQGAWQRLTELSSIFSPRTHA